MPFFQDAEWEGGRWERKKALKPAEWRAAAWGFMAEKTKDRILIQLMMNPILIFN